MDFALVALMASQLLVNTPAEWRAGPAAGVPSPIVVGRAVVWPTGTPVEAAAIAPDSQGGASFVYSEAYFKRLAIHRAASYAILPLFALQLVAGMQLYDEGPDAPAWAKVGHRVGATGVAALFVTNVATGVPNLIEGRKDPQDRARRFFHATMMLTAAAGFTATGILSERAETSPDDRDLHRTVALTSVTIATIGYLSMLDAFRP